MHKYIHKRYKVYNYLQGDQTKCNINLWFRSIFLRSQEQEIFSIQMFFKGDLKV